MQAEATNFPGHAPGAGFAPVPQVPAGGSHVSPIGDTPVLSLVPPAMQGDHVVHPDPVSTDGVEQQPLPTSAEVPVAPVRRREKVKPLIELMPGASLSAALQVAPLLPGQMPVAGAGMPQVQPLPAAYGVAPTTFPFASAPAFGMQPPAWGMMPQPLPMQMFVAYVMLMPVPMPTPVPMPMPVQTPGQFAGPWSGGWQGPQPPAQAPGA